MMVQQVAVVLRKLQFVVPSGRRKSDKVCDCEPGRRFV